MKKIVALALLLVMASILAACRGNSSGIPAKPLSDPPVKTAPAETDDNL